ncbi:MAG: universal stress protein [Bacteroidales bacterium]
MSKRIIVPIDFSEESLKGLQLAFTLAKKIPSYVEMVYVRKKTNEFFHVSEEKEKKLAKKKFDNIVSQYKPLLPAHAELSYIVKAGKIYQEVVNQAASFEDSFLVSSTHGASGFENLFIGSNTFKIITATKKPVFTIRETKPPEDIRKIVLPLDNTYDTRQKIVFTTQIAKFFNAKIHIVKVCSNLTNEIEKKLNSYSKQTEEYLDRHEILHTSETLSGDNITDLTLDYASKMEADLISIMTEQSLGLTGLIIGGNAQDMLNKSPFPVLSITPKELSIGDNFRTQG